MSNSYLLLTPVLTFLVVLLVGFVGCDLLFGLPEVPDFNPPLNLTGTAKHNEIDLSWQKPAKGNPPTGYRIYRHGPNDSYQPIHDNDTTTSYPDMTVMDGVEYTYKIARLDGSTEGDVSNEFKITAGLMGLSELIDLMKVQFTSMTRNNFGNYVGIQITIGSTPIIAKTIGRYKVPGNTGTHTLKLIDKATLNDLSGGQLRVNLSLAMYEDGKFAYVPLPQEVTLNPNSSYFIISEEMNNGDFFHDSSDTKLTEVPPLLTAVTAVNGDGVSSYTISPTPLEVYGPPSLQY